MNITINNNKDAVDRTNYGLTRQCTRLFEMHHKQRISLAAVMTDAKAIRTSADGCGFEAAALHRCACGFCFRRTGL